MTPVTFPTPATVALSLTHRVRLAVHKDTRECVAVKMVSVDQTGTGGGGGLTQESLRKEVP